MRELHAVLEHIDAHLETSIKRWFELLRIPSVSTDPAYEAECRRAADWVVDDLTSMGFTASCRKTTGHPVVIGHHHHAGPDAPHVLFYGHYDVQPADPLELWDSPPFEPAMRERNGQKQVVARGANDDKGQFLTFVEACRAILAESGALPVNVSILIEGEEECGSPSIGPFLLENKDEITADIVLVSDTNMLDAETPAISTMLRGLVYEELTITAPNRDLHSGHYGGAAQNPLRLLCRILAELHDKQGRIAIPGFYDGVLPLDPETKAQWQGLDFDAQAFLQDIGLKNSAGEQEYSVLEQTWSRPSCDINGIYGGYTGQGAKTVIPSQATAKVSFRLVEAQDPVAIQNAFRRFIEARVPEDCSVAFTSHGAEAAVCFSSTLPAVAKARAALSEEWGRDAVLIGMGGSIPIVSAFKHVLGMDALLVGFGLEDDCIHSPNEKYNLTSFHKGIRSWVRILARLSA